MTPEEIGNQIIQEARPGLDRMSEEICEQYGLYRLQLSQPDVVQLAMALCALQDRAFLFGIQMGIEVYQRVATEFPHERATG